ncbi:MAG: Holliday junction branch migration protein RuvA [Spirochaetota bacterium]
MIRLLKGKIENLDYGTLLLDVQGVVYEVFISYKTFEALQKKSKVTVHIYHSITDRNQKLFGFYTARDRELFQHLKSLNGIGEMTALRILSYIDANTLLKIVADNDKSLLEKIPKIKGKTSEKILFEIKQNFKKFESFANSSQQETVAEDSTSNLAVLALLKLGFDEKTANSEVNKILQKQEIDDVSQLIKEVLKVT